MSTPEAWPPLPLGDWRDTYETLHMWTQIVGKTCLALAPMQNHWWQVAFHLTPRGLATSPMPHRKRTIQLDFDFLTHELAVQASDGKDGSIPLAPRSVAEFYAEYLAMLRSLGIEVRLMPRPVEVDPAIPFPDDHQHASYDAGAVTRWWRAALQVQRVFDRFRGRFQGKQSPAHFFWGSFDLATTRFSGRVAPEHPGGMPNVPDYVAIEAYSRECASAGFWPGGALVAEPAFYAYAYPEPAGYTDALFGPEAVYYHTDLREFVLPYDAVRGTPDPATTLLQFLQSTYAAAADLGAWDRACLDRPRALWP